MPIALIVIGLLAVLLIVWLLRKGRAPAPTRLERPAPVPGAAPRTIPPRATDHPQATQPWPAAPAAPPRPLPAALANFQWRTFEQLPPERLETLRAELRRIPRPPNALHRLASPEFIASATSAEMAELVLGEPQIAAKVLSTVNSPLYGLQKTVTSIGQAITFLGMNAVRNISMQYLLDESFKAETPECRRAFDQLWAASALASELCSRLSKQLNLPDAGSLLTKLVLSFVGPMAVTTLSQRLQRPELTDMSLDLPLRYTAQQEALGLCAPEIGRLLMREWELPDSIIDGVEQIERVLVSPLPEHAWPLQAARQAVAYLSARLGERLACGALVQLGQVDLASDERAETHHLQAYLRLPPLSGLGTLLQAPETQASVAAYLTARRAPT